MKNFSLNQFLKPCIYLLFFCFLSLNSFGERRSVWIDFDPAFTTFFRDPDDGWALVHALKSSSLEIRGISTVFGNTKKIKKMKRMSLEIIRKFNRKIPVYEGASSKEELRISSKAVLALKKALEQEKLTILCLGRLTNIATLIELYPELIHRIKEVVILAGSRKGVVTKIGNRELVLPDTNIDDDTHSARIIVNSKLNKTLIPVESMSTNFITKSLLKKIKLSQNEFKDMAIKSKFWRFAFSKYLKSDGFIPWDLFVVSYLTHPLDFECYENIGLKFVLKKNNASHIFRKKYKKSYKYFVMASYEFERKGKNKYCMDIDDSHLENILLSN